MGLFYAHAMETIVQFVALGDVFMARGQRHIVRHVIRQASGLKPQTEWAVLVIGERADGTYFEAEFPWGDQVDIIDRSPGRASGS